MINDNYQLEFSEGVKTLSPLAAIRRFGQGVACWRRCWSELRVAVLEAADTYSLRSRNSTPLQRSSATAAAQAPQHVSD